MPPSLLAIRGNMDMDKETYTKKIEDLFTSYYEKQLSAVLKDNPQYGEYTCCAFINVQHDFLIGYIRLHNKLFRQDELSEKIQTEYDKALVQQMFYVLHEGDFHQMSGYDVVTNTVTDMAQLEKRYIAPAAKLTLKNAGLLYRGLDRTCYKFYPWRY